MFTSRQGTSLTVLAEGGREFREDGQFADADGGADADGVTTAAPRTLGTWRSRFVDTANGWHGSAVDVAGRMRSPPVVLDRDDWDLAARRGDPAIAVHIPAAGRFNGPMTRDACADSFRCALPFFAKFLPGFRPRLFTCESWMLDPQLAQFLPPESRIVSFQRFFQLLPVPGADGRQAFERVFGGAVDDWSKVPRDTALRRIMAEQAAVGVSWRIGAGVMLPEGATGR